MYHGGRVVALEEVGQAEPLPGGKPVSPLAPFARALVDAISLKQPPPSRSVGTSYDVRQWIPCRLMVRSL
jgi:hypothetical protein